jgi:hypothetical protein
MGILIIVEAAPRKLESMEEVEREVRGASI